MGYLPINDFIGYDGHTYRDLAVDSTRHDDMLVWLRRRVSDGKYLLVVSVVGGHVLKQELKEADAEALYHAMSTKVCHADAFMPLEELRKFVQSKQARKPKESVEEPPQD